MNQRQQQYDETIEISPGHGPIEPAVLCDLQTSPLSSNLPIQADLAEVTTGSSTSPQVAKHNMVCVETSRGWKCQCPVSCNCQCHISSTFGFPTSLRMVLGTLFVGYSGSIIFGSSTCDNKSCRRRKISSLRMTYYFPTWFLANVISFCYRRVFPSGPKCSLQISRIRPKSSDVFLAAIIGDIGWLQSLFKQGLASPFDVAAEDGQSVLQVE